MIKISWDVLVTLIGSFARKGLLDTEGVPVVETCNGHNIYLVTSQGTQMTLYKEWRHTYLLRADFTENVIEVLCPQGTFRFYVRDLSGMPLAGRRIIGPSPSKFVFKKVDNELPAE